MRKIIFLDFDGVLNNREWLMHTQHSTLPESERYLNNPCSPVLVSRLQRIISATEAAIVFSTSWRIGHTDGELMQYMVKAGFKPTLGMFQGRTPRLRRTPEGEAKVRGDEIQAWLDSWSDVHLESFIILDDDSDMAHLMPRLVQTNTEIGLTDAEVMKAIHLLNEGK